MGNEKVKTYASPYELEGRIPFGRRLYSVCSMCSPCLWGI